MDWIKPSRQVTILAAVVVVLIGGAAEPAAAQRVIVPGTWYDRDKLNVGGDHFTRNSYDDVNGNGVYDPGEPNDGRSDYADPSWTNPMTWVSDGSCWAAAGSNVMRYMSADDRYLDWVYRGEGYSGKTWQNGGWAYLQYQHDGYPGVHDTCGVGVDASTVLIERLATGQPVVVNFAWDGGAHAITCYGHDADTDELWLADSDSDPDGRNLFTSELVYNETDDRWYIDRYGADTVIDSYDSMAMTRWEGSGTDGDATMDGWTTDWEIALNWDPQGLTDVMTPVSIDMDEAGVVRVDHAARCMRLVMQAGRIDMGVDGHLQPTSGQIMSGQLNLSPGAEVTVDGQFSANGEVNVRQAAFAGGDVHIGYDAAGSLVVEQNATFACDDLFLGSSSHRDVNHVDGVTAYMTVREGATVTLDAGFFVDGDVTVDDATFTCHGGANIARDEASSFTMRNNSTVHFDALTMHGGRGLGERTGEFTMWDGELTTGVTIVGGHGEGRFTQFGGTHRIDGNLIINDDYAYIGTYMMQGELLEAHHITLARDYLAYFYHWAGRVVAHGRLAVGFNRTGNSGTTRGEYELRSGGELEVWGLLIGEECAGVFTQSGGSHVVKNKTGSSDIIVGGGSIRRSGSRWRF